MSDARESAIPLDNLETVDDDSLKTIYVDGYWGVSITDGVMKLNLYETRTSPIGEMTTKKYIVARIAIPLPSFFKVADAFSQLSVEVKKLLEKNEL
jgi:hypothetical protein